MSTTQTTPENIVFDLPHLEMVPVLAGTVILGDDKNHTHLSVSQFYISKFPVTQALYKAVRTVAGNPADLPENPSSFKGDARPVESINWHEAKRFAAYLNELTEVKELLKAKQLTGYTFQLPSEAEWEYAAKGGHLLKNPDAQAYEYCGSDDLKQVGWYRENSGRETKPVGFLLPNELDLHDMSGNVYEWCEDDWHSTSDLNQRPNDDSRPWMDGISDADRASFRVVRGGSCFNSPFSCRSACRDYILPDNRLNRVGFRLVLSVQEPAGGDPKSKKGDE